MGASTHGLTRRELEGLLTFAEAALRSEDSMEWWEACAAFLLGPVFNADVVAVASIDHSGTPQGAFGLVRPEWADAAVPTGSDMHVDLVADHPLTSHLHGPCARETARVSDIVPLRRWRAMAGFSKMRELIGATNQLSITVRADHAVTLSVSPIRACPDFTDHEVLVAERLKGLLQAADAHSRLLADRRAACSEAELAIQDATASHFRLTRREMVVLGLLADGLKTVAIARTLRISPRTVSKHQGNLYRKLGVRDRLAAVLLARRTGLVRDASTAATS